MKILGLKYFNRFLLFFYFIFALNSICHSQYYTAGIDPASVKWNQIATPHFCLIYPTTFENHAQYIANALEYVYTPGSNSINLSHSKLPKSRMPVLIHNQTTIPSSVTPYAPRRMDFFTTPPQDMYPQDWIDQLVIHEYRHASQYATINHGFTKALSYMLGEHGTFSTIILFVPLWFVEGDATVIETALHRTGRGRTPSFEMRLRTQFVDKGIFSYEKSNGGSYRDFVPGKYELGYQLVGSARDIYGTDMWGKVLDDVGRHPYTFGNFSAAIKKQTGFTKFGLYDSLTSLLQKKWLEEDKNIHEDSYQILTKKTSQYTNYNLPAIAKDSFIIAVKSPLRDLSYVVRIDKNGKEKKLFATGVNFILESLSSSDSILYWSEMTNDPRWSFRDYRVIKTYNYRTGRIRQLTRHSRYYAPSISSDGNYIAAVDVTLDNKYFLTVLNAKDGSVIKKISTPDNLLFIHPRWSSDDKSIVSVVLGKEGNSIALIDPQTDSVNVVLPYTFKELKRSSFYKDLILYQASYNGKDNIYCLNPQTHVITQVTSSRFGASDEAVTKDQSAIIYSNYTSDGYQLVKESLDPQTWDTISTTDSTAFPLAEKLTQQENFIFNPDSVPKINYQSKPYKKALSLFNFHSWVPIGIDIDNFSAEPGITLLSQNLLSTNITGMGYLYNKNQRTNKIYMSMSNESLYPAFDFRIDYGDRRATNAFNLNNSNPVRWNEFNITAGIRLPLNWVHNAWQRSIQPDISINYKAIDMDKSVPLVHEGITTAEYSLTAKNQLKMSLCDVYPRWGQQLELNYINTPFDKKSNSILTGQITLDVPGIFSHHGLRLYAGYQKKYEAYYKFSDYINFPRCYDNIYRDEIYSLSAYYSMPLCLPDWQLGHVLYVKRLKTAVFYDYAHSNDKLLSDKFSSAGLDLTMDFTFLNFIAPFNAGLRSAYIPEKNEMKFEFLFGLNINSIY